MFENPQIVERFLDYWRVTGHQRIGFLYGTYEIHADVPLGIRATVSAIYEPPQVVYQNCWKCMHFCTQKFVFMCMKEFFSSWIIF